MQAIYSFFGMILGFFSDIMGGSYLLGLLLFALMIKILLLPFGIKQQKSSIRQAKLKPKEDAIRKKYKGRTDSVTQQKMQTELTEMYQTEGYNPMGGCLPMILQMVIILLLYQAIINPLQYVVGMDGSAITALKSFITSATDAELSGKYDGIAILKVLIENSGDTLRETFVTGFESFLKAMTNTEGALIYSAENVTTYVSELTKAFAKGFPNFDLFGMENFLAEIPNIKSLFTKWTTSTLLVLVPLLNFGATLATSKLTKKLTYQPMQATQQNLTMKLMDWFPAVMTLWIAFVVPAAIGIYWLFNNVLGVAQQFVLHKAFPLPKFTEEDYKTAERELAGKAPKDRPANYSSSGPARSLYLEDFDEDDKPETAPSSSADDDVSDQPIAPAKPKNSGSDKSKDKYE